MAATSERRECPNLWYDPGAALQPKRARISPSALAAAAPVPEREHLAFWELLLAKEPALVVFLGLLSTPCFTKLESLCRKSRAALKRHWPLTLDLSEIGVEGSKCWFPSDNASSFNSLLAQPKWRHSQVLRFPASWYNKERSKYGRKHILTEETMKAVSRNLPDLQEVDLLPYTGTEWTGVNSRIEQFRNEFSRIRNLQALKMELWDMRPMMIFNRLPNLRVLHLRMPRFNIDFDGRGQPFWALKQLHSLEELRLIKSSSKVTPFDVTNVSQNHMTELQNMLLQCPSLRDVDITACIGWPQQILQSFAAHPKLETLAFFARSGMHLAEGLAQLNSSNSLKHVVIVQRRDPALPTLPVLRPGITLVVKDVDGC